MVAVCSSVWEKTIPQLLPKCQTPQFLPICYWCPSWCCPSTNAQRDWAWESPCAGLSKRRCLRISQFLPPTQFLLDFIARSYENLSSWHRNTGLVAWHGAGIPHSQDILPFYIHHTWVWDKPISCLHISTPPIHLDENGFFNSLVGKFPQLHFLMVLSNICSVV